MFSELRHTLKIDGPLQVLHDDNGGDSHGDGDDDNGNDDEVPLDYEPGSRL